MNDYKIKVYVKLDKNNVIKEINSSCFLENTEGWVEIDEWKEGLPRDKYAHAQGHYLPLPTYDSKGRNNYKLVGKTPIELTEEEKEALFPTPTPQPTQLDVIEAQTMYTALMTDTLLEV